MIMMIIILMMMMMMKMMMMTKTTTIISRLLSQPLRLLCSLLPRSLVLLLILRFTSTFCDYLYRWSPGRDISCDFDDDDCGYTNTGSDTFGWTRIRKNSTSAGNGESVVIATTNI